MTGPDTFSRPPGLARPVHVIAFTGMPGSGKSEAVEVARKRGIPVVTMGDFIRAETRKRGLDLVDANVGKVATEMRQKQGADYWARLTADEVLAHHKTHPIAVIDGVRNHEEVVTFRQRLGDRFVLVAITAPPETRMRRLTERGRADDPKKAADFSSRDERELGWGIARSIALADHALVNEGDLVAFRAAVAKLLDQVARE